MFFTKPLSNRYQGVHISNQSNFGLKGSVVGEHLRTLQHRWHKLRGHRKLYVLTHVQTLVGVSQHFDAPRVWGVFGSPRSPPGGYVDYCDISEDALRFVSI